MLYLICDGKSRRGDFPCKSEIASHIPTFFLILHYILEKRHMSLRKLAEKAKAFDAFPKVEDDNQQRSEKGGILTVLVALCLFMLTMSEFSE